MSSMKKAFGDAGFRQGGNPHAQGPAIDHKKMTEYYDQEGCIRREVFVDWAHTIARAFSDARVTRTRLRRLYEQVLATRARLRLRHEQPSHVLRSGLLALRRAAEHLGKRQPELPQVAVSFITVHVDNVGEDTKKFDGFFELFQSVYAYMPR